MMHSAITLYCMGLDSIMHHEAWLEKWEVRRADRSVHEQLPLQSASPHELNLPSLAPAEL